MTKKKAKSKPQLTTKQQRFVEEYLIDLNATQAAIRAGYSKRSAEITGCKLLRVPKVASSIARAMEARSKRTKMDADEAFIEFARVARSDMLNYMSFGAKGVVLRDSSELTEDQARAISEVSETVNAQGVRQIKIKLHDKNRALENVAKHLGLFVNRHEFSSRAGNGDPVPGIVVRFAKSPADKDEGSGEDER
jgi:phage terminase small subunit